MTTPLKPAPVVPAHPASGGTAPNSKQRISGMLSKAGGVTYAEFVAAGWTDAELRAAGFMR